MNETEKKAQTITCQWFALCANPTTEGASHPVLGVVPICPRCAKKLGIEPEYDLTPA